MPSNACSLRARAVADHPLLAALLRGDRRALARAITLVESTHEHARAEADQLLTQVLPRAGGALRLGVSGAPGAGKSTFIEALGLTAISQGRRVAVLAIDPSSGVSGGSILGDKTRMEQLAVQDAAFIRPSPSSGTLGGVAGRTREAMILCEAAGYDVVVIETVGVGQSETAVAAMTDLFLLLQLPNAGDDLQAIKRGVMELAHIVVVNKADLDADAARRAAMQLGAATAHRGAVHVISALRNEGVAALWNDIVARWRVEGESGARDRRRREQDVAWMWETLRADLVSRFVAHPAVVERMPGIAARVEAGELPPAAAARLLLNLFLDKESS